MDIKRSGSRPLGKGRVDSFTGTVYGQKNISSTPYIPVDIGSGRDVFLMPHYHVLPLSHP
jgi:hypothetical protein